MQKGLLMVLGSELDFQVIAQTECCEEAKLLVKELKPDVMLVDLDTPGESGMALAETTCELAPATAVVLLSLHDDQATCAQARKAGVAALVGKTMPAQSLFSAIRAAAKLSAASKNASKSDVNQPSRNEMRGKR